MEAGCSAASARGSQSRTGATPPVDACPYFTHVSARRHPTFPTVDTRVPTTLGDLADGTNGVAQTGNQPTVVGAASITPSAPPSRPHRDGQHATSLRPHL